MNQQKIFCLARHGEIDLSSTWPNVDELWAHQFRKMPTAKTLVECRQHFVLMGYSVMELNCYWDTTNKR